MMLVMSVVLFLPSILTPLTVSAPSVLASSTVLALLSFMLLVLLELVLGETAHDGSTDGANDAVAHLMAAESAGSAAG